jgi:exoribonuclease II
MTNEASCTRKNYPFIGVVLRKVNDEGQNMVQTLTGDGRIIAHVAYDILYAIPGFVDPFHIKRCGIEEKPINSKELMARVSVAEKLRRFNKSSEDLFNGYAAPFNSVYPTVSALDEDAWSSVTVAEAAKLMRIQPRDLDRNCSVALHAVYSRLMKHSKMFVMNSHNFASSQTFHVRPRSHVERFDRVSRLMYNDSSRVREFTSRAKKIILRLRKTVKTSKTQTPSYKPVADIAFTEDDKLFIHFVLDSLVDIRSVQTDPYSPFICEIIKSLDLYYGDVDSTQVRQFLVDLGVLIIRAEFHRELLRALETASVNL